jgi:hypothetical protein
MRIAECEQTNGSGDCRMVAATVQPKLERWLLTERSPEATGSTPPENAVATVLLGKNVRSASGTTTILSRYTLLQESDTSKASPPAG